MLVWGRLISAALEKLCPGRQKRPGDGPPHPPARTSQEAIHTVMSDPWRNDSVADAGLWETWASRLTQPFRPTLLPVNECRVKYKTVVEPTDLGLLDQEQAVSGVCRLRAQSRWVLRNEVNTRQAEQHESPWSNLKEKKTGLKYVRLGARAYL